MKHLKNLLIVAILTAITTPAMAQNGASADDTWDVCWRWGSPGFLQGPVQKVFKFKNLTASGLDGSTFNWTDPTSGEVFPVRYQYALEVLFWNYSYVMVPGFPPIPILDNISVIETTHWTTCTFLDQGDWSNVEWAIPTNSIDYSDVDYAFSLRLIRKTVIDGFGDQGTNRIHQEIPGSKIELGTSARKIAEYCYHPCDPWDDNPANPDFWN